MGRQEDTAAPGWTVADGERGARLAAFLRARAPDRPWSEIKRWIASGKVFVDDAVETSAGRALAPGATVRVRMAAPRPREPAREVRLVHDDAQVVVVDKPPGVMSVPYERRDGGTAMDLVREVWRRRGQRATETPLHIVHRIDKDTSGLLVFAKTRHAERALGLQFRAHTVERTYLCVAEGTVPSRRIESWLVRDRGDGLRGSSVRPGHGKRAVTTVRALQALRGATLCEVKLETGRTHQIRIHLAEAGHPIVGERVYVRDRDERGPAAIDRMWGPVRCSRFALRSSDAPTPRRRARYMPVRGFESPRLLLHAATLGFVHPTTAEPMRFESPVEAEMRRMIRALGGRVAELA
jgi:23S rRNA pseudouridine1911/1915/1917 synthase